MDTIEYDINDITIIDNFLPEDYFMSLKDLLGGSRFPWFKGTILPNSDDFLYNIQMGHMFYIDGKPVSDAYQYLSLILELINPDYLIRIKGNITFNHNKMINGYIHTDTQWEGKGMTGIMYFDTCNGYTEFPDQDLKVKSVQNRICIFPNEWKHGVTRATDVPSRTVINFNWFDKRRVSDWDAFVVTLQKPSTALTRPRNGGMIWG